MFTSGKAIHGRRPNVRLLSGWKRMVPQILAGLGVAIALAGCEPVQSVSPFFDSKEVVFEPQLVGEWGEVSNDENHTLTITRVGEESNLYGVRFGFHNGAPAVGEPAEVEFTFQGQLFRINGVPYVDLLPERFRAKPSGDIVEWEVCSGLFAAPTHTVYRVWLSGDRLKLAYLDDDRVRRFVREKDLRVATASPAYFLLTGTTQELQSQILATAEDEGLLDSDGMEFQREK
jgi:hypothetical protein